MTHALIAAVLGGLTLASLFPAAATPAPAGQFDPRQHRAPIAGQPTAVMVLGSPHLSGLPASFQPDSLTTLIDRLVAWKPDRIAIEGLSGPQCDHLRRYKAVYPADLADQYCFDPAAAQAAAGLDGPAATAAVAKRLAAWPQSPTAADRRRLALLFLAAGERPSALVQWLRLLPAERHAADGLTPELAQVLDETVTRRNENYLLAPVVAARLGHERVWMMDDHTADIIATSYDPGFEAAMKQIWSSPALDSRLDGAKAVEAKLGTPAATLAMYRHYNEPAEADRAFETDFGAAMRHDSPGLSGRRYLGWWETRNLRMAANIREVAALDPGSRLLVITGASHKGYLDAYLGMMHDMRVESPLPLLD